MKKLLFLIVITGVLISCPASAEVYLNTPATRKIFIPMFPYGSEEPYFVVSPGKSITLNYTTLSCNVIGSSPIAVMKVGNETYKPKEGHYFVRTELIVHGDSLMSFINTDMQYLLLDMKVDKGYELDQAFTEMAMSQVGINDKTILNRGRTIVIPLIFQVPKEVDFTRLSLTMQYNYMTGRHCIITFEPISYNAWWD